MTDCRAVPTDSNLYTNIAKSEALQREVDAWIALGNKPTEATNSDEVYARGRTKNAVVKEAKERKKSTFFFGCAFHGDTRFSTETKKCLACTNTILSRGAK